jgi:hypothetical protein
MKRGVNCKPSYDPAKMKYCTKCMKNDHHEFECVRYYTYSEDKCSLGGQEGQQGPAVERDGDDGPSEPGPHEQRGKALYQRRVHGTWRSEVVKQLQQLG